MMLVGLVLTLPAAWLLPLPYKAIPVLLAAGLLVQLAPVPRRWPRQVAQGCVAAALILLAQSLVLWIYAVLTARHHELPWLLSEPLGLLPRLWGIESAVDGSSIVLRCGQEIYRIEATWELLLDPATVSCFVGGFVLLGLVFRGHAPTENHGNEVSRRGYGACWHWFA